MTAVNIIIGVGLNKGFGLQKVYSKRLFGGHQREGWGLRYISQTNRSYQEYLINPICRYAIGVKGLT